MQRRRKGVGFGKGPPLPWTFVRSQQQPDQGRVQVGAGDQIGGDGHQADVVLRDIAG